MTHRLSPKEFPACPNCYHADEIGGSKRAVNKKMLSIEHITHGSGCL